MGPGEHVLNVHGSSCAAPRVTWGIWDPKSHRPSKLTTVRLILIESDFKLQEFGA